MLFDHNDKVAEDPPPYFCLQPESMIKDSAQVFQ